MSSPASPTSYSTRRRAMIAVGVVAALIGSVAVTSSANAASELVSVATITTAQTEIRVDRMSGGDDIFGTNNTNTSYLKVEWENFTDTEETYGLAADMGTAGVEQRLWLPETWPADTGVADFFSIVVAAQSSARSAEDGLLPDWPGETFGFYRIAIDGEMLLVPELVGTFKNDGFHVNFVLDETAETYLGIGQPATFVGTEVYPGANTVATAGGLVPGEQLGLWLSPGIDYFSFMLSGARLADEAVYAGEGFVSPNGTLTATLAVPPNLTLGSYQLLVGNVAGRNWPAGTTTSIEVVAAPSGTPASGSAVVGPTVDNSGVNLSSANVSFKFDEVQTQGVTTATVSDTGPTVSGFEFAGGTPLFYYLHTSAVFTGPVEVCFSYDTAVVGTGPFDIRHFANGAWETLAEGPSSDNSNGVACGMTDSFSPFVLAKAPVVVPVEVTITKVQDCRHGGWATSTNPVFTSMAKCVTYIALKGRTVLK